jgi:hypothetical protein
LVVDEICEIARQQLDSEERRDGVLAGKAASLLGIGGLSVTLAFAFGSLVLQHPEQWAGLGTFAFRLLTIVFGIALALGIAGSLMALWVLKVRPFETVNEADVFCRDELADVERERESACQRIVGGAPGDPSPDIVAQSRYRRYLLVHYWTIYRRNRQRLEEKACWLLRGQKLHFAFMVALMLIGTGVAVAAFRRSGAPFEAEAILSTRPVRAAEQPALPCTGTFATRSTQSAVLEKDASEAFPRPCGPAVGAVLAPCLARTDSASALAAERAQAGASKEAPCPGE